MDSDSVAACQLISGIIGACRYLRSTRRNSFIKEALIQLQQNEDVQEVLFPTELRTMSEMLKRTKQSYCVEVGPPGRDFTIEHYSNETLYVFDKTGKLIEVVHDYSPE